MSERPELMPADTPDYMIPAWIGCMHWAIGEPNIPGAYREQTGDKWEPGRTGIDRAIDEACGADKAFAERFIRWANAHVWGPLDGDGELAADCGGSG
jgi:hypothetical protein